MSEIIAELLEQLRGNVPLMMAVAACVLVIIGILVALQIDWRKK